MSRWLIGETEQFAEPFSQAELALSFLENPQAMEFIQDQFNQQSCSGHDQHGPKKEKNCTQRTQAQTPSFLARETLVLIDWHVMLTELLDQTAFLEGENPGGQETRDIKVEMSGEWSETHTSSMRCV